MKARLSVLFFAAAALLLPIGTAAAAPTLPVSFEGDAVLGIAVLSNKTAIVLTATDGTATVGRNSQNMNQGHLETVDLLTQAKTSAVCMVVSVATDCTQANLICGVDVDHLSDAHQAIGAIPNSSFKGSLDGVNVVAGFIMLKCQGPVTAR
jgi:hypothetical protein